MNTTARELFRREEQLARRYRTRKLDILFQSLRCPNCETEGISRRRFMDDEYSSVEDIEGKMLAHIHQKFAASCSKCGNQKLNGDGARHFFLLFSEQQDAHLVVSLKLSRESDGRTLVTRKLWFVPVGEEGVAIEEDDGRLDDFWTESRFRSLLNNPLLHDFDEEFGEFLESSSFRHIVLREYASLLIDEGSVSEALGLIDTSLTENPEQPALLMEAAGLHASYSDHERATELFIEAWDQTESADALAGAVVSACKARKFGTTEIAAAELLENERYAGLAAKALVATGTATNISSWKFGWKRLHEIATASGDRVSARVAKSWSDALELPIPDWKPGVSTDDYRGIVRSALAESDLEIVRPTPPLVWGEAKLECDLIATDPFGARYAIFITDLMPTAAVVRTLVTKARALILSESEDYKGARGILLTRQVFPYSLYRYFSDLPDAQLDLEMEADPTLIVHQENVATWLWAAERYFGSMADYSVESLDEVDRILLRFHDDGFGAIEHPMVCVISSYIREVMQRAVGPCEWKDGDAPMDPRVLQLPDGGSANIMSRIYRMVEHGQGESVQQLVTSLIELVQRNLRAEDTQ